jgi:hypothetical protein
MAMVTVILTVTSIPALADAYGGPKQGIYRLRANSFKTFTVSFVGGRAAVVMLKGDGDTDLDLYIYDENDNLVARDTDNSDYCIAEWLPRWTGEFTIKVVNHGRVYNDFAIITN